MTSTGGPVARPRLTERTPRSPADYPSGWWCGAVRRAAGSASIGEGPPEFADVYGGVAAASPEAGGWRAVSMALNSATACWSPG